MGIQAALGQVTALVGGWRRNQARRDSAVTRGHLARGRKRDPLGDDVGAHLPHGGAPQGHHLVRVRGVVALKPTRANYGAGVAVLAPTIVGPSA